MGVKIIDYTANFVLQMDAALDRALNAMAIDVERMAKAQVPFKKGQLKASGLHKKLGKFNYIVLFNKEYAAFQEWGQDKDGKRVVKKYSRPGKGKFFLRDPVNLVQKKAMNYYRSQVDKIKI